AAREVDGGRTRGPTQKCGRPPVIRRLHSLRIHIDPHLRRHFASRLLRCRSLTRRRPFATFLRAACGLAALWFSSAGGAQAPMVGPRGAGMAGAVTAAVDDATAIWVNPAGLARIDGINADLLASGLASNRNGFTGAIERLSSLDLKEIVSNHDLAALQQAVNDVQSLALPGTGAVGSGIAGLVFAKGGFAIAIDDVAYAGAYPTIDLVRVLPVDDPNLGIAFNQTGASFAGLEAREARFSYARSFFEKVLLVGGTLRYVNGRTYFFHESIFDLGSTDPVDLVREALKHNAHDTGKFTWDLGAMVNILGVARIGLSSTSINEPEFTVASNPSDPTLAGAPATIRLPRTF